MVLMRKPVDNSWSSAQSRVGGVQSHSTRVQMFPSLSSLSVGIVRRVYRESTQSFDTEFTEEDVLNSIDRHASDILYNFQMMDQLYLDLQNIAFFTTGEYKIELIGDERARIDFINGLVTTVLTVKPLDSRESKFEVACTATSLGYDNTAVAHTFPGEYDFGPLKEEVEAVRNKNREERLEANDAEGKFNEYYEGGMFPLFKDSMEAFGNYHINYHTGMGGTRPYTRWAAWADHMNDMNEEFPEESERRMLRSWKVMHLLRSLHRVYLQALVAVLSQPCQIFAQLASSRWRENELSMTHRYENPHQSTKKARHEGS